MPKEEIVASEYDLSLNRYREIVSGRGRTLATPKKSLAELEKLEAEIASGLAELKAMLFVELAACCSR